MDVGSRARDPAAGDAAGRHYVARPAAAAAVGADPCNVLADCEDPPSLPSRLPSCRQWGVPLAHIRPIVVFATCTNGTAADVTSGSACVAPPAAAAAVGADPCNVLANWENTTSHTWTVQRCRHCVVPLCRIRPIVVFASSEVRTSEL